jgi:glycosyltransferase involved in cell wall biosynthesis
VPVIVCSRLSLGNYRDEKPIFARLEDFTDRFFTLIHCKSQGIRDDVMRREPVDPDDLRVIYNGINTDAFCRPFNKDPLREELGLSVEQPVVGMVANLKAYKGHIDLINAAPAVLHEHPETRFLFVGRDDGIQGELLQKAEDLGILDHIIFAGERHDVPRVLQLMTILVSASHEEGFSNTILEAMASGLPVIATRVGGNLEQVADGLSGYLVNPSAPGELAESINILLSDRLLAEKMGRHGSTRAARNFSHTAISEQMQEFYREAIAIESAAPTMY